MNSSREPELLRTSKRPPAYQPANNVSSTTSKSVIEQKKKTFVFGSSTPRELSHIDKVARKNRLIDGSVTSRESSKGKSDNDRGIVYYMRQVNMYDNYVSYSIFKIHLKWKVYYLFEVL